MSSAAVTTPGHPSPAGRHDEFLEQHLEDIRKRLQEALSDVGRSVPHVHPANHLAFPERVERDRKDQRQGDRGDLEDGPEQQPDGAEGQKKFAQPGDELDQGFEHAQALVTVRAAPVGAIGAVAG
jgi:hypothetical protein